MNFYLISFIKFSLIFFKFISFVLKKSANETKWFERSEYWFRVVYRSYWYFRRILINDNYFFPSTTIKIPVPHSL